MKKTAFFAVLAIAFLSSGCASKSTYDFALKGGQKPMVFEDENIKITFSIFDERAYSTSGDFSGYKAYSGLIFVIQNKTKEKIILDWNKMAVTDAYGSSGRAVMHKDVKFSECSGQKNPNVVLPGAVYEDSIIPCYGLNFVSSRYGSFWSKSFLPPPDAMPEATFGLYMPMTINRVEKDYSFEFVATKK